MHICVDRDNSHKSFVIRRGKHEISMSDHFFRPIVIQTKDKVLQKKPILATFNEKKNEIDQILSKSFMIIQIF